MLFERRELDSTPIPKEKRPIQLSRNIPTDVCVRRHDDVEAACCDKSFRQNLSRLEPGAGILCG